MTATPPLPLDDITKRSLVIAKQLFTSARQLARTPGANYRRILTIVTLDLAAETAMYAAAKAVLDLVPPDDWRPLLGALEKKLGSIPDKARIEYVHRLRNDAQHRAMIPSEEELSDARTYTRDFLSALLDQVWASSLDALTLGDAIADERYRALIGHAETELAGGETLTAARTAHVALTTALSLVSQDIVGQRNPFAALDAMDLRRMAAGLGKFADNTNQRLEQLQGVVLFMAVGLDQADLARCRAVTGTPFVRLDGAVTWHPEDMPAPEVDEAAWVVDFCATAIATIEQRVGSLEAPIRAHLP